MNRDARDPARHGLIAAVVVSVIVTACSIAPVGSPSPAPTLNPNQLALSSRSPARTVEPTRSALPTATSSLSPSPSSGSSSPAVTPPALPHADPELEALLPTTLSKVSLSRLSTPGSTFTAGGDMCILVCGDEPYRYAKELGIPIEDVTIAFAVDDRAAIGMIAYRARGAATDRLIPARIAIGGYTGHGGPYTLPVTVAGRPATYLDAGFGAKGEYLMTRRDALFIVFGDMPGKDGSVPAYVTEALASVP